jgi:hypothetical protein
VEFQLAAGSQGEQSVGPGQGMAGCCGKSAVLLWLSGLQCCWGAETGGGVLHVVHNRRAVREGRSTYS